MGASPAAALFTATSGSVTSSNQVGASTSAASPQGVQKAAAGGDKPGPTFVLTRGGGSPATEGVRAPPIFLQMGLTSMLDVAEAFDDEQDVRETLRAISQSELDLAVATWKQCDSRKHQICKMASRTATSPARPTGPTLTPPQQLQPPVPPDAPTYHRGIHPPAPFAPAMAPTGGAMLARGDEVVDEVKQRRVEALLGLYYAMGPHGLCGRSVQ